jgi:hypothetical protein
VGLLFVVSFVRSNTAAGLFILVIYASLVVPNSMHPNWYGAFSFVGRFMWAGATVILPVVLFGFIKCAHQVPRFAWPVMVWAFFTAQGVLWYGYTFEGFNLYPPLPRSTTWEAYPAHLDSMSGLLPALFEREWFFLNSSAIALIWTAVFLVPFGAMLTERRSFPPRLRIATVALYMIGVAGIVAYRLYERLV